MAPFFAWFDQRRECPALKIASLEVHDLRVIRELRMVPGPGINLIVGANGAGKTSILEAIYLAGRGRTFRHPDAGPLIRNGAEHATVLVTIDVENGEAPRRLGVRRAKRDFACRLDGEDVRKRSVLVDALPVQWIGSQPQALFELGPEIRRRFLDMGLFHVEHGSYLLAVAAYQRLLRQRNAAVKTGRADEVRIWNTGFAEAALTYDQLRRQFAERLQQRVQDLLAELGAETPISFRYRSGWRSEADLGKLLEEKTETDLAAGYTTVGPHRADLEITGDGVNVAKKLSRGQQKILVLAIQLALSDLVAETARRRPILLIDDLAAELDRSNQEKFLKQLVQRKTQVFLALIDSEGLPIDYASTKMFHVEHGAISNAEHV